MLSQAENGKKTEHDGANINNVLGATNLIELFERFERWDGLYLYLRTIVKDSTVRA